MIKILKLVLFLVLSFVAYAFASNETLTITTYYPSPYGSYNQLKTNMLAVGSATSMPSVDGQIAVRNILMSTASINMPAGVTY